MNKVQLFSTTRILKLPSFFPLMLIMLEYVSLPYIIYFRKPEEVRYSNLSKYLKPYNDYFSFPIGYLEQKKRWKEDTLPKAPAPKLLKRNPFKVYISNLICSTVLSLFHIQKLN